MELAQLQSATFENTDSFETRTRFSKVFDGYLGINEDFHLLNESLLLAGSNLASSLLLKCPFCFPRSPTWAVWSVTLSAFLQ